MKVQFPQEMRCFLCVCVLGMAVGDWASGEGVRMRSGRNEVLWQIGYARGIVVGLSEMGI